MRNGATSGRDWPEYKFVYKYAVSLVALTSYDLTLAVAWLRLQNENEALL